MEVPDKVIEKVLSSVSKVLLEEEDVGRTKNLRNLTKSYNNLLKVADEVYEHDFPYFDLNNHG